MILSNLKNRDFLECYFLPKHAQLILDLSLKFLQSSLKYSSVRNEKYRNRLTTGDDRITFKIDLQITFPSWVGGTIPTSSTRVHFSARMSIVWEQFMARIKSIHFEKKRIEKQHFSNKKPILKRRYFFLLVSWKKWQKCQS